MTYDIFMPSAIYLYNYAFFVLLGFDRGIGLRMLSFQQQKFQAALDIAFWPSHSQRLLPLLSTMYVEQRFQQSFCSGIVCSLIRFYTRKLT